VYEALTQQYELAKVQEAKETPSVKVLDGASVPERKSFPPRTFIALLGAFSFLGIAAVGLLIRMQWNETDANDPGKLFAQEVFQTVNQHMPWASSNGSRLQALTHKARERWLRNAGAEKSDFGTK
jgi:hypothetical protein